MRIWHGGICYIQHLPLVEDRCLEAFLQLGEKHEVTWMTSWPIWEVGKCCATHLFFCLFPPSLVQSNSLTLSRNKRRPGLGLCICIWKYDMLRFGL